MGEPTPVRGRLRRGGLIAAAAACGRPVTALCSGAALRRRALKLPGTRRDALGGRAHPKVLARPHHHGHDLNWFLCG